VTSIPGETTMQPAIVGARAELMRLQHRL